MIWFGFIRNIMVGRKGLTQAVLLAAFQASGATNARSFLATGNIAFELDDKPINAFLGQVCQYLTNNYGCAEPIFARSLSEVQTLQAQQPFGQVTADDVHERCVTFLPDTPIVLPPLPIYSARKDVAIFAATDREAYSITRLINGRTSSAGRLIENVTRVPVTTRNWNTIEKMLRAYP